MVGTPETVKIRVELEGIEEIRRFHVEPGDVLILQAADNVSQAQFAETARKVKDVIPGVQILICGRMKVAGLINAGLLRKADNDPTTKPID